MLHLICPSLASEQTLTPSGVAVETNVICEVVETSVTEEVVETNVVNEEFGIRLADEVGEERELSPISIPKMDE